MKKIIYKIIFSLGLTSSLLMAGCSEDLDVDTKTSNTSNKGTYVIAELKPQVDFNTRMGTNPYDNWGTTTFSLGDQVGLYARKGMEDPDNPDSFALPIVNEIFNYEGMIGTNYRFGNNELSIDPNEAGSATSTYSCMYYPYYEGMPPTYGATPLNQEGMWLRVTDDDGIEKCIDFLSTYTAAYFWPENATGFTNYTSPYYWYGTSYGNYYVTVTNGLLSPSFYHACCTIGFQRGEGFRNAQDKRIWVVTQHAYTDIRIYQSSSTGYYYNAFQYHPKDGEELMIDVIPDETELMVNKYRVWQAWEGNVWTNGLETYYVIVPPGQVSFVVVQDDYGTWHTVTDFYLYSSSNYGRLASTNQRYTVTIKLEGVNPVVRPVLIDDWNDLVEATDNRKVGIETIEEFLSWVGLYNLYIEQNRDPSYKDQLMQYGDGLTIGDNTTWTFYINGNIELPNNSFYRISYLDDMLEGSSQYTNYNISNLRSTLIGEIREGGGLKALNFEDLYVISTDEGTTASVGGVATAMSGGSISNCMVRNGILVTNSQAGMLVGALSGGSITGCTLSGDVIGSSTASGYDGMFGSVSGNNFNVTGNNTRGLNFVSYQ